MIPEFKQALFSWQYDATNDKAKRASSQDSDDSSSSKSGESDTGASSIPYQLQKLFARLQLTKRKSFNPKSITAAFGWTNNELYAQQDVQVCCVTTKLPHDRSMAWCRGFEPILTSERNG
jgi:hypothetical protein